MPSPSGVIDAELEREAGALKDISQQIWSKPELAYKENFAHDVLTEYLDKNGFAVEQHFILETAFRASYTQGEGGPHIVVICEYDALPGIGHACGHNLIAEAGIAAGLGLKAVLLKYPEVNGTVSVLGTPAEEDGGGKIDLIEAGAFANADVALMVHPDRLNMMEPVALAYTPCTVAFTGKAAHAAAAPWEGVNALDAAISAYQSLSMLRQQTEPDCRFHAVIPEGGKRPNIIPESTKMKFIIRSPTNKGIAVLKHKATNIMKAAALASGCDVDITYASPEKAAHYSNMVSNTHLTQCFRKHWESCNPVQSHVSANCIWASTDMGNVSYVVPSIHPTFDIGTSADIHSRDFATAAATHEAHVATLCVAKAMACVGWDVLTDPKFLCQVKETFKEQLSALIGPCSMPACTQLFNST